MSNFAERLNKVMQDGDTLRIKRVIDERDEEVLEVKFVTEDDQFGTLNQFEYIDAEKATPGKLIKTIEIVKERIANAVETILGAQAPEVPPPEEE